MSEAPRTGSVEEHTETIAGIPVFWRRAPAPAPASASASASAPPVLYVHGVPTSSHDWLPFLQRTGGLAPDLPGFGRSAKRGDWDYSIAGYGDFLRAFLDHLGVERVSLVMHDWGAVGLALAQAQPQRIARMAIVNCVPFLPGYRWHRVARIWRTRLAGELAMGATTRWGLRQISREANVTPGPLPAETIDESWRHFDQGTQRAILRLYRSAPPEALTAAGARLEEVSAPTLVLWGAQDPYIPTQFARDYAQRLPAGELRVVDGAGHWPWLDRPELIDDVADFLK